jgi:hypothetical protein
MRVHPKVSGLSRNETTTNTHWEATQRVMAAKLSILTHKIPIQPAPSGRDLYHLQFSLQAASPETFGYTLVICKLSTREFVGTEHELPSVNILKLAQFTHTFCPRINYWELNAEQRRLETTWSKLNWRALNSKENFWFLHHNGGK